MEGLTDQNNPGIREGDRIEDFDVKRTAALPEINAVFYELAHGPTGARYAHISTDDRENTFSVAFKTVPSDSTGVAHILEHTALCGSRHFPVRDPFFSMIKRSLSTFMNAFTASDWTMYPYSTQNRKDFYNLMDVYLDAAFLPNLDPLSFKQEGHRLEVEPSADGDRLVYKGVVYNEMKGAMSSPDQVMGRSLLNALYPDTTYGHNSGGDPAVIPTLTHQHLVNFHRIHYHPSNAYFYTYGNLPLTDHVAFLTKKVLAGVEGIDPLTVVAPQPRWHAPKTVTYRYPLGKDEDPEKKCQVSVAWLTADIHDLYEVLALTLLEQILIGNAASPLRKALVDSNLGSSLADGTGYSGDLRDTMFACGLKDVKEGDDRKIEGIVFDTLERLTADGIDPKLIESAIHQLEFHRKEVTNSPYPYGIKLMLSFAGPWFHGADPVRVLRFTEDLERLKAETSEGPFFEERIRRHFLENPHRVLFRLLPDQTMEEEESRRVAGELERIRSALAPGEIERLKADAQALAARQEAEEDVSVLPTLSVSDIPPHVPALRETRRHEGLRADCYEQPTSGIFYFTAAAGAGGMAPRLLPLMPFFCYAFTRIGSTLRDYVDMAHQIDTYTGGIGAAVHARTVFDAPGTCLPFVTLNGKCLVRNQEKMFDVLKEMVSAYDFTDLGRIKSLLLEFKAGLESMVVRQGHRLAMTLASRHFSPTHALNEIWSGIHQLKAIKEVAENIDDGKLRTLAEDLTAIGGLLFTRPNLRMALIGEEQPLAAAVSPATALVDGLDREGEERFSPPVVEREEAVPREGWSTHTAVSFVAKTFMAARMAHEDAPALAVIGKLLRSLFIHREIREKGGAYGGFSIYNAESGTFAFGSYRDPHVVTTLDVYRRAADFIRSGQYSDQDIEEAILQICSDIDKPDPPGPAARKAFYRKLLALSDETRNDYKRRILSMTRDQVIRAAERYFDPAGTAAVAVVASPEKLAAANRALGDDPLTLHRI